MDRKLEVSMNKILTAGMAALTLATGAVATATPAAARDWGHGGYYGYGRGNDDAGAAIAGGLLGFALGSAVSSHSYGPYYGPAYGPGYYGPAYGACVSRRSVWDPYIGRYVVRSFRYAC